MTELLGAEKVDAFLYQAAEDTLVAVGTSDTPLARKQVALGLHRLALSNGGQAVRVFRTGLPLLDGHVERDPDEVPGVKEQLGIAPELLPRLFERFASGPSSTGPPHRGGARRQPQRGLRARTGRLLRAGAAAGQRVKRRPRSAAFV